MNSVSIVLPNQLFQKNPALESGTEVFLIEEYHFFKSMNFHFNKLVFHRATMQFYKSYLESEGFTVRYIESSNELSILDNLMSFIVSQGYGSVNYCDFVDINLNRIIKKSAEALGLSLNRHENPLFINSSEEASLMLGTKKNYRQGEFYIKQRKLKHILVEKGDKPVGDKWSFDQDNRLKYPNFKKPPAISYPKENQFVAEAKEYVRINFSNSIGIEQSEFIYPTTYDESQEWFSEFLEHRFSEFGLYQDAILSEEPFMHHSIISPMLNAGLLSPEFIISESLQYASNHPIPLNSLEGFIRQLIGWREFVRGIYELKGEFQRENNFWGFSRKIPDSFWSGTTGILPFDNTVKRMLRTGYLHHIERLMVIGNFMLLCEIHPNDVYSWFMSMSIDAYDWVMVPNVYGMSQYADGGLMATKPYISSSTYISRMSNYKDDGWQEIWSALFWRFLHIHRDYFNKNARLYLILNTLDKMGSEGIKKQMDIAENFLNSLK